MKRENMISNLCNTLRSLCETIPPLLQAIDEESFSRKPAPGKWSKKEILGHLIDSAANNHQRFVRGQFEEVPLISYDQMEWNRCSRYDQFDTKQLISFWASYNLQLATLVSLIPEEDLQRKCNNGKEEHTLAWLFEDYVRHLEHHLAQMAPHKL